MTSLADGFARSPAAAGAPMRGPVPGPMSDPERARVPGAVLAIARLTGWRRRQRQTRAAALEAERVIRRARETALREPGDRPAGEWDGNVYRPKSFDKPKKPH